MRKPEGLSMAEAAGIPVGGLAALGYLKKVRELGAYVVLDYTERDCFETEQTWDLMLDVVGEVPISRCLALVAPGGAYVERGHKQRQVVIEIATIT